MSGFKGLEEVVSMLGCSGMKNCLHCSARRELNRAKKVAKHARQIFLDGQLDKYPTSDDSDEYHLWRLVKRRGE